MFDLDLKQVLVAYSVLLATWAALLAWGHFELNAFLKGHAEIQDENDLDDFKRMARKNMYGAICFLALAIPTFLLGIYFIVQTGWLSLVLVLAIHASFHFPSKKLQSLEAAARNLPCADDVLLSSYRKIGETWMKKALPDF